MDSFPVVWRIFPIFLSADFLHSLLLCIFSGATEEGENDDQNSAHWPGSKAGQRKDDILFVSVFLILIFVRFLVYKYSIVCLPSRKEAKKSEKCNKIYKPE